jgi:hypothetical protein
VLENASCQPRTAGAPDIERVTLSLLAGREQLDGLYDRSRALAGDAATSGAGVCSPGPWFTDAARTKPGGRRFCTAGPPRARIVWTVNDSRVLAEAAAAGAPALEEWWSSRRNLRAGAQ